MQEEDLVQVTLVCPNLDFPIRLPFMQMNKLTSELLLIEIERVLQSNEQLVLDHCVQLNITKGGTGKRCDYVDTERSLKDKRCIIQIQNKDDMCCARAIVTAKAKIGGHEQWNSIRQSRRIQEELALELHTQGGRFTIKLKMIGEIVRIVDDTSKDQHALISTTRRRHWETQRAPPITNVRTADKP